VRAAAARGIIARGGGWTLGAPYSGGMCGAYVICLFNKKRKTDFWRCWLGCCWLVF